MPEKGIGTSTETQEQAKRCGTTTGTVTSMAKTGNGSEDTMILQWTLNRPSS